jgi:PhzF family phenazine biosynthesis protein
MAADEPIAACRERPLSDKPVGLVVSRTCGNEVTAMSHHILGTVARAHGRAHACAERRKTLVTSNTELRVQRIAAFSDGDTGGNPAGVVVERQLPDEPTMRQIAREIAFSETVFAAPTDGGWRVRYFSPESEVAFCGHATIALGAVLALARGDGVFALTLNDAKITVEGRSDGNVVAAALQSPPTRSTPADPEIISDALTLFGYTRQDLDGRIPPALASAGPTYLVLALASRHRLSRMRYDLAPGREFMNRCGLVTIALICAETSRLFHARNAFASGGVYEDPATGASAAALAGYLRDIDWPHGGAIDIIQGEDMGSRSHLRAEIGPAVGSSIRVSGTARVMGV